MYRRFAIGFLLSALINFVEGWGKIGHEIVGNLAYDLLSEEVKVMMDRIIGKGDDSSSTSLGRVASWADVMRFTHEFHWTTPLHYVDIHDSLIQGGCESTKTCQFVYARDCEKDMCAVAAITELVQFLSPDYPCSNSRLTSSITEEQGLAFLVHFVGDIHQPLHVSRQSDRGGNDIHIVPPVTYSPTTQDRISAEQSYDENNLHAVWDDGMIDYALSRFPKNTAKQDFQQQVASTITPHMACPSATTNGCSAIWAQQSLYLALTKAYVDEHNEPITSGTDLTLEYYETRLPIIQQQLAIAAARLAATLETIYSSNHTISN